MKRSNALTPLSREHHHALVLARELSRAGDRDAEALAGRFRRFLVGHELGHFSLEESLLLPAVPTEEPGPTLAQRVLDDHEYLRGALQRVEQSPANLTPSVLHEIGARLRAHVQMEERELFPYLEQTLSSPQLEQIGADLRAAHGQTDP